MTKETMNKIVKHMAKNQNKKSKLNAGQLREVINLYEAAAVEIIGTPKIVSYDYYKEHILSGDKKIRTKRV